MYGKLIFGLFGAYRKLIFDAIRITQIKHADLYMLGWLIATADMIVGLVNLFNKSYLMGSFYSGCALVMIFALVYIGRTVGLNAPRQEELIHLHLECDAPTAITIKALIVQGMNATGPGATILDENGKTTMNHVCDYIQNMVAESMRRNTAEAKG